MYSMVFSNAFYRPLFWLDTSTKQQKSPHEYTHTAAHRVPFQA